MDNNWEININKIAKTYNTGNKTYKTDKKNIVIPKIKYFEVIKAL